MALKQFLMIGAVAAVLLACGDDSSSATDSDADSSSSSSAESSSSEQSSSSVTLAIPCKTDSTDTCEYGALAGWACSASMITFALRKWAVPLAISS
ncbi:hypothetical protein [Fibrobacter sp.]|uniref:hypothetical protein n=1 Tax=Fibrobacter sp. TaxID=35828 RepID=UPI0025BB43BA|nr:hypothetical protein [Fibrobacter sp.]MBR3073251.1 hypothetical protein [Fibrobacter sp.]